MQNLLLLLQEKRVELVSLGRLRGQVEIVYTLKFLSVGLWLLVLVLIGLHLLGCQILRKYEILCQLLFLTRGLEALTI